MKLFRLVTGWGSVLVTALTLLGAPGPAFGTWESTDAAEPASGTTEGYSASFPGQWQQPAAALSEQIAAILGPAQAALTIHNLSSIANSDLPAIRALFEQDLKARGIALSGAESANSIRITLSQNDRERLWVAEIVQGNETRVVMVEAGSGPAQSAAVADYMTLRRERLPILKLPSGVSPDDPFMAVLEANTTLVALRPEAIDLFAFGEGGWQYQKSLPLNERRQLARDARGLLMRAPDAAGFTAFAGQTECSGAYASSAATPTHPADGWSIHCRASDEPWPILQNSDSPVTLKAFYNSARNYFTGVITPNLGVDLPPFYSAALLPRPAGTALLIGGIDGKVQIVDSGVLRPVSGARDWGSDFAVLKSGCGSGAQVIASGSGEAASDSLRAYELPAQEAVPASAPLAMNGSVVALWPAPDDKSLLVSVRQPSGEYEVDRVSALCN